jgi:TRAP-type uncharacterized transport system fused permease subunit
MDWAQRSVLTGLVFAFLFLCVPLSELFDPDDVQVIAVVAVVGSVPVAVYYLTIYNKLIKHFELRNELGGLVKSKH